MTTHHRERDEIVHWTINDGRIRVGTVDLETDGVFVARDTTGKIVGRFDSLLLASRVFELVESER
jgi:hypothetical protein